jgi:hypothetical protein
VTCSIAKRALVEYRTVFCAFVSVHSICFATPQNCDISMPIAVISIAAEPIVDAKLNNAIESLAPVPAIPITLAIVPISAIFSGQVLASLSFYHEVTNSRSIR